MNFKNYFKQRLIESLIQEGEQNTQNDGPMGPPDPMAPENFGPDYPFHPYYNPFGYDPNEYTPPKPTPVLPPVNTRERNQRRAPYDYRD